MVIYDWKLKPYWSRLIIVSNVDARDMQFSFHLLEELMIEAVPCDCRG